MDGQRKILNKFAGIPVEEVIGIRAPQLALGGDVTFEVFIYYKNFLRPKPLSLGTCLYCR